VAQRVGRGIALLFHDLSTRSGWAVSSTPRPHFTPEKDPVFIVHVAGWAPRPVWTGVENLAPTGIRSLDRPVRSELLYRLSYPTHKVTSVVENKHKYSHRHYVCYVRHINNIHIRRRALPCLISTPDPCSLTALRIAVRPDSKQILCKAMTFYFRLFHFMFVIIREK
jgi:hypothetical protein